MPKIKVDLDGKKIMLVGADRVYDRYQFVYAAGIAIYKHAEDPIHCPWERKFLEEEPYIQYNGPYLNVFYEVVKTISDICGIPVMQKDPSKEEVFYVMKEMSQGEGHYWRVAGRESLSWLLSAVCRQPGVTRVFKDTEEGLVNVSRFVHVGPSGTIIDVPETLVNTKKEN